MLNATLSGVLAEGWGAADEGGNVHFWEYNSRKPDGTLVDVSKLIPLARQFDKVKDAKLIADYSNPSFVLGGWKPEIEK